jgi:glycosyltransferase involved in cell wall biosynthesis
MEPRDLADLSVCFLAGTLAKGGAEQQLYYMVRALRRSGSRVRVLSLTSGESWEEPILKLGVPVIWVGQSRYHLSRLARIVHELRADRPDVVQSAHFYTNSYALAGARLAGVREIGAVRCDVHSEVRNTWSALRRFTLANLRTVAANSRAAIRAAEQFGAAPARLHFLPNVVDTSLFQPSGRPRGPAVQILGAGRLAPQKRFDRFLSVLAEVRKSAAVEVHATVVGNGPLRLALEQRAAELGLASAVTFRPAVSNMATLYQQADLLLLTSDYEGTPNVVLEAMASGVPVVATGVGGVPEIVKDGETGFLAAGEEQLVARAADLVASPERRTAMGRAARAHVLANHSIDRLPVYLRSLYFDEPSTQRQSQLVAQPR